MSDVDSCLAVLRFLSGACLVICGRCERTASFSSKIQFGPDASATRGWVFVQLSERVHPTVSGSRSAILCAQPPDKLQVIDV